MQSSFIWPACSPNIPRCLLVNSLKYVVAYFVSTGAFRTKLIGGLSWINKKISSIMRNILQPDPMWSEERNGVMVLYQIYTNWNGWKYDSEALVNSNGLRLNSNNQTNALQWIGYNALMSLIVTWINIYVICRLRVGKASKQTLKHYFYEYLSQSDTCQLESA